MIVRLDRNYDYPELNRQTPKFDGVWEDLILTEEKIDECDLYIVLNSPAHFDYNVKCSKGGRILILQEPPYGNRPHLLKYQKDFDIIISHINNTEIKNIRQPAMLPWMVDKDYSFLKELSFNDLSKQNIATWVTSNKQNNPGHEPRLKFLDFITKKNNSNIQVFGKGINPIDDKFDVLSKSKYTIAIENYSDEDYWTEKIMDSYLSLTIPIYYGCTNLEKYFPKNSFINIDITKPEMAYDKIQDVLSSDYFETYKHEIIEARDRVLEKYQIFPWIKELIDSNQINLQDKSNFEFYKTPNTNFWNRIKSKISK